MEKYHLINILYFLIATLVTGVWMYRTQSGQNFIQWLGITFFGVNLEEEPDYDYDEI